MPDWFDPVDEASALKGNAAGWIANPVGTNRYAYAGNDPVNKADPNGHVANFVIGAIFGAAVDIAIQAAEIELGVRDEFSLGEVAASAVLGAASSGLTAVAARTAMVANKSFATSKVLGKAGEKVVAKSLRNKGLRVMEQVEGKNSAGTARADGIIASKGGSAQAYEVKTGSSVVKGQQKRVYDAAEKEGIMITQTSKNAPDFAGTVIGPKLVLVFSVSRQTAAGYIVENSGMSELMGIAGGLVPPTSSSPSAPGVSQ